MRSRLRRRRPSRDVLLLRATTSAPACIVAAALVAARPVAGVAVLGVLAAVFAIAGAVAPRWPGATITLALLAIEYAVATQPAGTVVRILAATAMAAVLWSIHLLFAAAAEVPIRAAVRPAGLRRWKHRILTTLGLALPLTVVTAAAGSVAPSTVWLRTVGLIAAIALAALPGLLAVRASHSTR